MDECYHSTQLIGGDDMAMLDEILLGKKITCDLCGKEAREGY